MAALRMRKMIGNWVFGAGLFGFCMLLIFGLMKKDEQFCRALLQPN